MKYDQGNGGWWVKVNYHLVGPNATAATCFDDKYDLQLAGLFEQMDIPNRVEAMMTAAEEFAQRHSEFTLEKPDTAAAFLEQTSGRGVLWFKRKQTQFSN